MQHFLRISEIYRNNTIDTSGIDKCCVCCDAFWIADYGDDLGEDSRHNTSKGESSNASSLQDILHLKFKKQGANILIQQDKGKEMNYRTITSTANQKVKKVLDIKKRKGCSKNSLFLIEGLHLIEMALNADIPISEVFFTETFSSKKEGQQILRRITEHTSSIFHVSDQVFSKLAETEAPQGIIAVAACRTLPLESLHVKTNALLVVSDGIQDPGNLGTIIRTADAAGADAIVMLPGTCDAYSPKVVRASAGSLFSIPMSCAATDELLDWLRFRGIQLIVTAVDAESSLFKEDLTGPLAFAFGNEAHGVQDFLERAANTVLRIPLYGKAESLNVAASAAICLYETARQRNC